MRKFLLILCLVAFGSDNAAAKWKPEYENNGSPQVSQWYAKQHNKAGDWCCDQADGHSYYGSVTRNVDGSITLDGGIILPAFMVLDTPNPTGHAVWWYGPDGGRKDYCFALPTMG